MINYPYEYKLLCVPQDGEKIIGDCTTRKGIVDLGVIVNFEEALYADSNCTEGVGIYLADGSHFTIIGNYDEFKKMMVANGLLKKM